MIVAGDVLKRAIEDLLDVARGSVAEAMDRHFATTFRQRIGGRWLDRAEFSAGISELRVVTRTVAITVLDEMVDGARYAERHRIELTKDDGALIAMEVYVFAERDHNGHFVRIEEATVPGI